MTINEQVEELQDKVKELEETVKDYRKTFTFIYSELFGFDLSTDREWNFERKVTYNKYRIPKCTLEE